MAPCAGGDINLAFRLELADGRTAFLKTRAGARADEFRTEAAGLNWLAEPGGLCVPRPLAVVDHGSIAGLAIDWVEPEGRLSSGHEEEFGRGLATTHLAGAGFHGAAPPGAPLQEVRFGDAVLPACEAAGAEGGFAGTYAFRIEALAGQALDRGSLDPSGAAVIAQLAERLPEFAGPPGPPARLHGDLWSGNVMAGPEGRPWLIDPAAYGGNPEVDLAMLELFGSRPARFTDAYCEVNPLPDGHRERLLLWQVQPLLVHAVLFGGHYGKAAARAASAYVGS
jgi:fructosamine-3-kinase